MQKKRNVGRRNFPFVIVLCAVGVLAEVVLAAGNANVRSSMPNGSNWPTNHVPSFVLDGKSTSRPCGIQGTVAPLERITAENAKTIGKGLGLAWKGGAWRNERVNAQFSIWTDVVANNVRCATAGLKGPSGVLIPPDAVKMHFVDNVMVTAHYATREAVVKAIDSIRTGKEP